MEPIFYFEYGDEGMLIDCNCEGIRKIIIPATTEVIGWGCFENKRWIEEIIIPNTVYTIMPHAFEGCTSLKKIVIPSNISYEYRYPETFTHLANLTDINTGNLDAMTDNEFRGCARLKNIDFTSLTAAGINALAGTEWLKTQPYTKEGLIIGGRVVFGVDPEKTGKVTIPEGIVGIAGGVFANSRVTEVIVSKSVEKISDSCFEGSALRKIKLHSSITWIGDAAFRDCLHLEHIDIPASMQLIKSEAFKGCKNLRSVNFQPRSTPIIIDAGAFAGCPAVGSFPLEAVII